MRERGQSSWSAKQRRHRSRDTYNRIANPQGNGFGVWGYALGEFSPATVTGLKRVAAGPPPFQTNCFDGALGEIIDHQIVLSHGSTGAPIGSAVTGTLAPWETGRYLAFVGPAGANAPVGEQTNVRAEFSVSGATSGADDVGRKHVWLSAMRHPESFVA